MDIWPQDKRSQVMAHIRSKNTSPERTMRALLHGMGFRFRLHRADLPGCPDIVLPKYKSVVFVHGCFWHLHSCRDGTVPKTRHLEWKKKLERNVARDQENAARLRQAGWNVIVAWECEIQHSPELTAARVRELILGKDRHEAEDPVL